VAAAWAAEAVPPDAGRLGCLPQSIAFGGGFPTQENKLGFGDRGWKQLTGWATLEGQILRRRHFTPAVLERIAQRISECERSHTGELMLAIEAVSPGHEPDSHARALEVFGKLRVWDTPQNTGVLLYLALDRHRIELIADRGIAASNDEWETVSRRLQQSLRQGAYVDGMLAAVEDIEQICERYCPPLDVADNTNELPDRPVLL